MSWQLGMAYTPARRYHSLTDCRQMPLNYLISCLFSELRTYSENGWMAKKKHIPRNPKGQSNKLNSDHVIFHSTIPNKIL
jgi:hypothetical protein